MKSVHKLVFAIACLCLIAWMFKNNFSDPTIWYILIAVIGGGYAAKKGGPQALATLHKVGRRALKKQRSNKNETAK